MQTKKNLNPYIDAKATKINVNYSVNYYMKIVNES